MGKFVHILMGRNRVSKSFLMAELWALSPSFSAFWLIRYIRYIPFKIIDNKSYHSPNLWARQSNSWVSVDLCFNVISGEIIAFPWYGSYSNVIALKILINRSFSLKRQQQPSQFQTLGVTVHLLGVYSLMNKYHLGKNCYLSMIFFSYSNVFARENSGKLKCLF